MYGINKVLLALPISLLWIAIQLFPVDSRVIKPNPKADPEKAIWGKERVLRSLPSRRNLPSSRRSQLITVIPPLSVRESLFATSDERIAQVQLEFLLSLNVLRNFTAARLNVTVSDVTAKQISPLMISSMKIFADSGESGVPLQYDQSAPQSVASGAAVFNLTSALSSLSSHVAPNRKIKLVLTLSIACETDSLNEVDSSFGDTEMQLPCGPVLNLSSGISFLRFDYTDIGDEATTADLEVILAALKQRLRRRQ